MIVEDIPNPIFGFIYVLLITVFTVFLFRGAYTFYHNLKVYHKTPDEYENAIAYKGEPPDGYDIEYFVSETTLRQDAEIDGVNKINKMQEVGRSVEPEVVYDFDEGEKIIYGETERRKFRSLSFYLGLASFVASAIVVFYYMVVTGNTELQNETFYGILGALIMIVSLHVTIRIATLSKIGTYGEIEKKMNMIMTDGGDDIDIEKRMREKYRNDLHRFAFSLFMSLYATGVISIIIVAFTIGIDKSQLDVAPRLTALFAILVLTLPIAGAYISRAALEHFGVPEDLKKDWSKTEDIEECVEG